MRTPPTAQRYLSTSPLFLQPQPTAFPAIRAQRFEVPTGNAGVGRTLSLMRSLALGGQGAQSMQIIQLSRVILRKMNVPAADSTAEAYALCDWTRENIRFTGEHNDAIQESVQSPEVTLKLRTGDCDDFAILLSALLSAVGIDNRFQIVKPEGMEQDPDAPWSHVYVVAWDKRRRQHVPLDPTVDDASGFQFDNMQATAGGAEFGLAGMFAGQPGVASGHGLSGDTSNEGVRTMPYARRGGLGQSWASDVTSILSTPSAVALAQGEATSIAYGPNASLQTVQYTSSPLFGATGTSGQSAGQVASSLSPAIPTWMWIAGVLIAGVAVFAIARK